MKKVYRLGCVGHIDLSRVENFDEKSAREKIRRAVAALCKEYEVTMYCGLAYGADTLFAEEALFCGAKVCAVLPCPAEEFSAEQPDGGAAFNRLIARAEKVVVAANEDSRYLGVSEYIVDCCDEIFAIWDGKELPLEEDGVPVNCGGTYHTITLAKDAGKSVRFF